MACCNNECLENINAGCVEYTGASLQCIPDDSTDLASIISGIDALICSLGGQVVVSEAPIQVDLKCLGGDCGLPASFTLAYQKQSGAVPPMGYVTIAFAFADENADFIINSIQAYSGTTLIISTLDWINTISIPLAYIDNGGVLLKIDIIIDGVQYKGSFFIMPSLGTTVISNIPLICESTNVVTLPLSTILTQIITELCNLKGLIG